MNDDNLDALPLLARLVRAGGEDISITPFVVGDIPAVMRLIRVIGPMFASDRDINWVDLMAEHGDALINLVSIGSRRSVEWVNKLGMDEFITLANLIYEVNLDFFVLRLGPILRTAMMARNGPSPSAASSQPDTAART